MLWTIALFLMVLWLFGWVNSAMMGGWFIHALLSSILQGRRPHHQPEAVTKPVL